MSEEPPQRMESDSGESDSEDQPLLLPFASTGASEDVPSTSGSSGASGSAPGASGASGSSEATPFGASGAFRPYVSPEDGSRIPTTSVVSLLPTNQPGPSDPRGSSEDDDDDLEGTFDNMLQAYLSARASDDPRSQTERTVARWAAAAAAAEEQPNGPGGPVVPGAPEDEQQVQVTVKTLDDREVSVTIGRNQPVQQLIDDARRQLNVTTGNQRIIFGGRVLNSTVTLQNAGITNGQTVHMVDRGPSGANDRPNINVPRLAPPGLGHGHSILANHPHLMYRSMSGQMLPPPPPRSESPPAGYPYMRVPCKLGGPGGRTVLHARISSNVIEQRALPLILRQIQGGRSQNINLPFFMQDPAFIVWNFKIIETPIFRPRETFEAIVRQAINSVPYVTDAVKENIAFSWETTTMVLKVHFPEIPSHIPSPALERMNFLAFWTDHLTLFINKIEEADGLHDAVRQVLDQVQKKQSVDGLTESGRDQRCSALDEIIREFEKMWAGLSHMRDYERDRFRKFQPIYGDAYRRLKFEQHAESSRNPLFVMRHALDVELIDVIRDFRRQQRRFSNLEELLDLLNESGALKFVRDSMAGATVDYRLRALSMFFHYMQRARHLVAHMTHLVSELDVPILTPGSPQRILPHYAVNLLTVPIPYSASLSFQIATSSGEVTVDTIPVNQIMPPPRLCSDIGNPEWPHLPFYPPSVSADMAQAPARLVEPRARGVDLRHAFAPGNIRPVGPNTHTTPEDVFSGMSINDMLNLRPEQVEAILTQNMNIIERTTGHAQGAAAAGAVNPALSAAAAIRPRRIVTSTAGDTPSVPVETQPPPGNAARPQEQPGAGPRYTTGRFNVHPDARGPDTATLAPFPVQVEPRELQRIAKNIASRYREEALQRIATMLTTRFTAESWDTRINNLPSCTLRECIAVALELLASAGNDVEHSKNLMLALVRDEEVLVRAIAECVKSLFGRGEFPTHVARIIIPRSEAAGSRHDYESPDHLEESDEYDGMVVRMPSDVSQPQSGDLRAIRERRQRRREMMERNQQGPSTSTPSTSTPLPAGPSFNEEDSADIRAGRLPTRPRRIVRETVHPTPARAASPTQISVTFTATAHPIHHHHHHHHHHPQGPPPPPGLPAGLPGGLPTAMAAAFQAALSDVHNDDDDDTPRILRTTWLAGQNSPTPPPPGSSASSSFSGNVVHYPRGSWFDRQVVSPSLTTRGMMDFDLEADLEQASTSSAAGSSAALSSGAAAEPRAHSAPNTTHASPIRQQRGETMRRMGEMMPHPRDFQSAYTDGPLPQRRPRRNPSPKPMVAIDPFMACSNRFCELNMHSLTGNQETERFTMQSNMPDDEFLRHIQTFAPTFDRRPPCVPESDSDYSYTVKKSESGELKFDSVQEFKKFVQTAVRSLYATCIDSDSLITLNMNAIAGHAPSNHSDLFMAVRQFLNPNSPPAPPPSTRDHLQQMENRQRQADAVRHAAGMMAQLRGAPPFPVTGPASIGAIPINPSMAELEILESGRLASLLSFLGEYMQNEENPRPTGVFGMLLELTYERLTAHEYAQLARPSTAPNVIMEYAQEMQARIRGRYLDGRMAVSNGELHEIAARIANQETFFERFLMENSERMPLRFQLGPDPNHTVSTAWAFRQVEIGYVKSLLALAMYLQNPRLIAQLVIKFTHDYLYRNLGVFYRLANRDINQLSTIMRQPLARYLTTIRFRGFHLSPLHFSAAFEDWSFVINRWLVLYSASFEEAPFSEFLMMCSLGTDWNELETFQQQSPISSIPTTPGTATPLDASVFNSRERLAAGGGGSTASLNSLNTPSPITSTAPSASTATTANNSRKRNHTGRQERTPDTVDMVVAPLMTSLTTSEGPSTSSGAPGPSTSTLTMPEDHPMEE